MTSSTARLAALSAAVVLAVHLRALSGRTRWAMPILALAAVVTLACFAAFVRRERARRPRSALQAFSGWPLWGRSLAQGTVLYAGLNLILFLRAAGAFAAPTRPPQITAKGERPGRLFSANATDRTDTWLVRVVSAHLLPFLVVSGVYYYVLSRQSTLAAAKDGLPGG